MLLIYVLIFLLSTRLNCNAQASNLLMPLISRFETLHNAWAKKTLPILKSITDPKDTKKYCFSLDLDSADYLAYPATSDLFHSFIYLCAVCNKPFPTSLQLWGSKLQACENVATEIAYAVTDVDKNTVQAWCENGGKPVISQPTSKPTTKKPTTKMPTTSTTRRHPTSNYQKPKILPIGTQTFTAGCFETIRFHIKELQDPTQSYGSITWSIETILNKPTEKWINLFSNSNSDVDPLLVVTPFDDTNGYYWIILKATNPNGLFDAIPVSFNIVPK